MSDVRFEYFPNEVELLFRERRVQDGLVELAEDTVVTGAQARAPWDTGAGALSIRAEAVLDGPEMFIKATWEREYYYMNMVHGGTVRGIDPRPFLVDALEGAPSQ